MQPSQCHTGHDAVQPLTRVRELMTVASLSVSPNTAVDEARALMQHVRHLPVLEHEHLVGIVSDSDIRLVLPSPATSLAVYEIRYLLARLTVGEIMSRSPVTIDPDATAIAAGQRMLAHDIGALPVLEHGKVVGMLTRTDLLRAFVRAHTAVSVAA